MTKTQRDQTNYIQYVTAAINAGTPVQSFDAWLHDREKSGEADTNLYNCIRHTPTGYLEIPVKAVSRVEAEKKADDIFMRWMKTYRPELAGFDSVEELHQEVVKLRAGKQKREAKPPREPKTPKIDAAILERVRLAMEAAGITD